MEVKEFGSDNLMKIVMIPGNIMCWKQFEHVIPLLQQDYHVIAISTDGYDGTGQTTFTTAEASAEKLENYIHEQDMRHEEFLGVYPMEWCALVKEICL